MSVTNLDYKFSLFTDHWSPKVIAELNGQAVKLAKVQGEFVWHDHAGEDELFLIHRGTLFIDFEDRPTVTLNPGDLYVVPRGVKHRPRTADGQEAWIVLLEPIATKHTGEVDHPLTVRTYDHL
ncbi:mannose-6-phosphate isomerase-like protein (cupin superfamily) [Lewinella aquimaris]|uniref:Mannose-6-phosphate isomerase-like protein (Cupin superfamily) n=1 Tax=Neolewinella aquimaris TaxID=1835722 RepID=A0A840E522_9BACT|nr:cupin domain-containing protein [Neolewinella aquimaris]MBB4078237.1 mannose-6-phosphate isomerase-like protein (cupin superfamily) [Neolewinella aquimaris]